MPELITENKDFKCLVCRKPHIKLICFTKDIPVSKNTVMHQKSYICEKCIKDFLFIIRPDISGFITKENNFIELFVAPESEVKND